MIRVFLLVFALLFSAFAALPQQSALASNPIILEQTGEPFFQAQGTMVGVRWPNQDHIVVENRIGPSWAQAVESRANSWNAASPYFTTQTVHPTARACNFVNGRVVVCVGGTTGGFDATTYYRTSGRQILAVKIHINPQVFNNYPPQQALLCHELGHAFGLDHSPNPSGSCVSSQSFRTTPGPDDVNTLHQIYNQPWGV